LRLLLTWTRKLACPSHVAWRGSRGLPMAPRGARARVMSTGTGKLRDLLLDHLETDTVCYRIDPDMAGEWWWS